MGDIRIISQKISRMDLKKIAKESFGDMVKAAVDIERGILALGGELHADEEALLLDQGSEQKNLWGINLYPEKLGAEWIEFDSMINIRPTQGNRSRDVQDPVIRERIVTVVNTFIE